MPYFHQFRDLLANLFGFRKGASPPATKDAQHQNAAPLADEILRGAYELNEHNRREKERDRRRALQRQKYPIQPYKPHGNAQIEVIRGVIFLASLCIVGSFFQPEVMAPFVKELFGYLMLAMAFLFPTR